MIPELGQFALVLALCLGLLQSVVPLYGAHRGHRHLMAVAVPAARGQFLFVLVAFLCLTYAFVVKDFSVLYVATNSNAELPLQYRIAAVWGAHEGSLLLWALILAGWTLAVTLASEALPEQFRARVLAIMGFVSVGFLLFMLLTSNPFERLIPAAGAGRDLNPLLQDPGLIIHPPMLYMGYVGLVVPFSFAIAALLGGRVDATWTRWTRPWTTIAWVFLTVGITLGSWWAYYELGWGGWWFWDPVENASFMPWLVATALIHSLAVTEQRGAFRAWTVLLAIFAFSLSLLGTFLVRSGVLVSVHAFATDPGRGVFILIFLALVIGGALVLFAMRAGQVSAGGTFEFLSRETLLLMNNVLLVVASSTILLGTLYPLILDALSLGKISVGPPYFNRVFVPLMIPLIILVGIGPLTRWRKDSSAGLVKRLRVALVASIVLCVVALVVATDTHSVAVFAAIGTAFWIFASAIQNIILRLTNKQQIATGLRRLPRNVLGMTLAHIGVGVFIIGVTASSVYSIERDVSFRPGQSRTLAGYRFHFDGVVPVAGTNYTAQRGSFVVSKDEAVVARLLPEKRVYPIQAQPMTEAAINTRVTRDLYVALGEPLGDGMWSVRLYYKPFQQWIWLGPVLMALGGLLAALDRRYRNRVKSASRVVADIGLAAESRS